MMPIAHSACRPVVVLALALGLAACASAPRPVTPSMIERDASAFRVQRTTSHRDGDDLLTAGLGLAGLRMLAPPAFADAAAPTPVELRRRAIWSNWRGIADLAPGGGYGEVYGSVATVPGREFSALATVPGARQPHRVLVQVPDAFDRTRRCVLVAPSSGSRGVYGAIAVAGAWGLPKGCAVAYTDKGTGSDYVDLDARTGMQADGSIAALGTEALAFAPEVPEGATGVAFKHAHSQDNPEADWGRHVRQAAEFALVALDEAFPAEAPFTFANTRVIAVGISNGGGAVLRAAEQDGDWLDAVVAGEPSVLVDGHDSRALYDYTTEAMLLMPCALLAMDDLPQPPLQAQARGQWTERCRVLREAGLVDGSDADAQARDALARMRASGWTDEALRAGALSVGFDLWRAVAVNYASAYGRFGIDAHPCGYGWSAQNAEGSRRVATAQERAAWWSDASGIPPGAGVGIVDDSVRVDPSLSRLQCLRGLWSGASVEAERVHRGVAETRAGLPRKGLPVTVIHGADDGLIPMAFTSAPYVAKARAAGRDVRFWQVRHAQHFDAFLGLPDYGARYLPMLPYVYRALDRTLDALEQGKSLPGDAVIDTVPRAGKPLTAEHLALP
ncbi:3-hydroxybutyrate oligomer hydrolase family protein [Lysobacter brunescens]|uniref:3-hydroxybutyrate oligomer hydrolase family protein n=1 Tax=Lysobacter brunescens TaxID=262323 RepID=A0ABW2YBS4_9GAMM